MIQNFQMKNSEDLKNKSNLADPDHFRFIWKLEIFFTLNIIKPKFLKCFLLKNMNVSFKGESNDAKDWLIFSAF